MFCALDIFKPRGMTRVWCLYELHHAVALQQAQGNSINIMFTSSRGTLAKEVDQFRDGTLDPADTVALLSNAKATIPADKEMILGLVEKNVKGGLLTVQETVVTLLRRQAADAFFPGCSTVDQMKRLIAYGANLESTNSDGFTALHVSAKKGSIDLVKLLIEASANVNAKCQYLAETPLHKARDREVIKVLLAAGANNVVDKQGNLAISKNDETEVRMKVCVFLFSFCNKRTAWA